MVLAAFAAATPAPAAAQRYLLQLKPKVGDTLRMELEEQREHTGTTKFGGGDSSRTMLTRLRMVSRAIVQGKLRGAVTVLAIIDSVSLVTTDQHERATAAGQRMLFRLGEDGTMRVVDDETGANRGASELVALMPAALPTHPVAVGETWARSMSIPMVVGRTADGGVVRARFRLDSLSRDEELAYISMRGDMKRDSVPAGPPRGTRMQVSGTVSGELLLDRRRGWLTGSKFAVLLRTTMVPAATSGGNPIRFLTRITQRMRTLDRK
ncbi:MAG: hypothetical protein M3282_12595 [Gemmatimonadota bacterium]|nr:hypothetical protein [Gemmatimonadota bacterium]